MIYHNNLSNTGQKETMILSRCLFNPIQTGVGGGGGALEALPNFKVK